jgi:hypothetical protein
MGSLCFIKERRSATRRLGIEVYRSLCLKVPDTPQTTSRHTPSGNPSMRRGKVGYYVAKAAKLRNPRGDEGRIADVIEGMSRDDYNSWRGIIRA